MCHARGGIAHKLHVIDIAHQAARKLCVQIVFLYIDYIGLV